VRLQPRASRTGILGAHGEALRVAVSAPPVDGRANEALIEVVANALGVAKRSVTLIRGETSRDKLLGISGLEMDDVAARLTGSVGQ